MAAGLSVREFAERDGCSASLVQRAKKNGRLRLLTDGTIDPDCVGSDWRESARRDAPAAVHTAVHTDAPVHTAVHSPVHTEPGVHTAAPAVAAGDDEDLPEHHGLFATRAEAEIARDSYVAHLKRLAYERERGQLIEIETVAAAIEEDYSRVRTRLLALPAEQAPQLFRCKSELELQGALTRLIADILEELSRGGAPKLLG